jgi:hypothetical protein
MPYQTPNENINMKILNVLLLGTLLAISAPINVAQSKIEDLAWICGDWETAPGSRQIEEHWTKIAGGSMIGMSRTVAGDKTVFYKYLRIETRGADIYYVAHPKARNPGTEFKLVRLGAQEATFENPDHDFPKRIIYRKNADGGLTARIEGEGIEKEKPQEFHYRPMPK